MSNCAVVPTADYLDNGAQQLDEKIANYESHGNNWRICDILKMGFVLTNILNCVIFQATRTYQPRLHSPSPRL